MHKDSSADVTKQEMARGVVMQNLRNRMVTIMDLEDRSAHLQHYDQKTEQDGETQRTGTRMNKVSDNVSCLICLNILL